MSYETIIYEKRGPVAYVTLNRPDKLNALSDDLQLEVRHAIEDAGWEDEEIRVIVLKAAGRAFSAGFDITAGQNINAVERRARFLKGKTFSGSAWWDVFWNNPKPIIAQIHGFCIAGGLDRNLL
ncbi:MAG: enoyl-CoA hydratase/isomerase family protein [Alphaproteobacteria bacterium]